MATRAPASAPLIRKGKLLRAALDPAYLELILPT